MLHVSVKKHCVKFYFAKNLFFVRSMKKEVKSAQNRYAKMLSRLKLEAKERKIKVLFLVNDDTKWKCQSLYTALNDHPNFAAELAVIANGSKRGDLELYEKTCGFFKKNIPEFIAAFNAKTGKNLPVKSYGADIVFVQQHWDIFNNVIREVSKCALPCYIPYGCPLTVSENDYDRPLYFYLWKFYVLNDTLRNYLADRMRHNRTCLCSTGSPIFDYYAGREPAATGEYVIYAPHFSFYPTSILRLGTFCWSGDYLLDFARQHPEIKWLFKPHPSFYNTLRRERGEQAARDCFAAWREVGEVCESGDYLELFSASRAMITDSATFLLEYFPSQKPIIHLRSENAVPFNNMALEVIDTYYQARSLNELEKHLDLLLLKGEDPLRETRLEVLRRVKIGQQRADQNILADFVRELEIDSAPKAATARK